MTPEELREFASLLYHTTKHMPMSGDGIDFIVRELKPRLDQAEMRGARRVMVRVAQAMAAKIELKPLP